MKESLNKVFMYVWLAIFILSSIYFTIVAVFDNWKKAQIFLLIIPASLLFFIYRRSIHKKSLSQE